MRLDGLTRKIGEPTTLVLSHSIEQVYGIHAQGTEMYDSDSFN